MINRLGGGLLFLVLGAFSVLGTSAAAQAERYVPTIWVDPDGCEHWVMDDGAEGYMSPHLTPEGLPVCRQGPTCGTLNTDQFFATDQHRIDARGRARLLNFSKGSEATVFSIAGHTDARASDAYNLRLSQRRANAVAAIVREAGKQVSQSVGYGKRKPRATNNTAEGMSQNRRVEIICVR